MTGSGSKDLWLLQRSRVAHAADCTVDVSSSIATVERAISASRPSTVSVRSSASANGAISSMRRAFIMTTCATEGANRQSCSDAEKRRAEWLRMGMR